MITNVLLFHRISANISSDYQTLCRLIWVLPGTNFMINQLIKMSIKCPKIVSSKGHLQIASLVQPTVQNQKTLHLFSEMTKKNCKSLYLRSWNQQNAWRLLIVKLTGHSFSFQQLIAVPVLWGRFGNWTRLNYLAAVQSSIKPSICDPKPENGLQIRSTASVVRFSWM